MSWYGFSPYVAVAERKKQAAKEVEKLKKKGHVVQPIILESRKIANTFWGKAWCQNLESYSDYANRVPRGRTYVRNGSVIDLRVAKGEIVALVSGSSIYKVKITIAKVLAVKWDSIVKKCAGSIDSVIELLQGKFSDAVMKIMTDPKSGLFPNPDEIKLNCSCPDSAVMCKHVAAVLYGVGVRLDQRPEDLFLLRQADHIMLIAKAETTSFVNKTTDKSDKILDDTDLSALFGIDLGGLPEKKVVSRKAAAKTKKAKPVKKILKKKLAPKKSARKVRKDH